MARIIALTLLITLAGCNHYDLKERFENPDRSALTGPAIKTGLFAFWNFNGHLNDSWDNGTGLQNGAGNPAGYTADRYGRPNQAATIPGLNSVNFGTAPQYSGAAFSLCLWLRMSPGLAEAVHYFNGSNGYALSVNTATTIDMAVNNTTLVSTGSPPAAATWHYICMVYENPNATIYSGPFNGTLAASTTGSAAMNQPSTQLQIGALGTSNPLDLDDVVFYTRKLSLAEANENFMSHLQ